MGGTYRRESFDCPLETRIRRKLLVPVKGNKAAAGGVSLGLISQQQTSEVVPLGFEKFSCHTVTSCFQQTETGGPVECVNCAGISTLASKDPVALCCLLHVLGTT